MRQITQNQIKQYRRPKKLESIVHVSEMSEDMSRDFRKASVNKCPLDPLEIVKSTSLKTVAFIVCGERFSDDSIMKSVLRYDDGRGRC